MEMGYPFQQISKNCKNEYREILSPKVNQAVKICLVKFDAKQCLVYYHAFLDIQHRRKEKFKNDNICMFIAQKKWFKIKILLPSF